MGAQRAAAGLRRAEGCLIPPPATATAGSLSASHAAAAPDELRGLSASFAAPPFQTVTFSQQTAHSAPLEALRGEPPPASFSAAALLLGGGVLLLQSDTRSLHSASVDADVGPLSASASATLADGLPLWECQCSYKQAKLLLAAFEPPALQLSRGGLALRLDATGARYMARGSGRLLAWRAAAGGGGAELECTSGPLRLSAQAGGKGRSLALSFSRPLRGDGLLKVQRRWGRDRSLSYTAQNVRLPAGSMSVSLACAEECPARFLVAVSNLG